MVTKKSQTLHAALQYQHSAGAVLFNIFNILFLIVFAALMIYPIANILAISLSEYDTVAAGKIRFFPVGFHLGSYKIVFENPTIMRSYLNTIIYSLTGTAFTLMILVLTAYPLAIRSFSGRRFVIILYMITMYFGGGLIPTYLLIRALGMVNTMWAIVIPPAAGIFHIVIVRTNFQRIPEVLRESAYLDGASDLRILFSIYLPLSLPILSTMFLFIIVGRWNEFFTPLIYLSDLKKQPLQVVLRQILITYDFGNVLSAAQERRLSFDHEMPLPGIKRSLQASAVIVSVFPIMCIYPFIQRYFVQGVLIGSIKG